MTQAGRLSPIRPQRALAVAPGRPEHFPGGVLRHEIKVAAGPGDIDVVAVYFDAGARTIPHSHDTDQVLHVVEGEGIVAMEDERLIMRPGDWFVIPANAWHWHGATTESSLCQVAMKAHGSNDWTLPYRDWDTYMDGAR